MLTRTAPATQGPYGHPMLHWRVVFGQHLLPHSDHRHTRHIYLPKGSKNETWEGGKKMWGIFKSVIKWWLIPHSGFKTLVKKISGAVLVPRTYSSSQIWNAVISHSQKSPVPNYSHPAVFLWLCACACHWSECRKKERRKERKKERRKEICWLKLPLEDVKLIFWVYAMYMVWWLIK